MEKEKTVDLSTDINFVGGDVKKKEWMRYMISAGPLTFDSEIVKDCPPGVNQCELDEEFARVLTKKLIEEGKSKFAQPLAVMIDEESVSFYDR